jgi:hypothetical protein
VFLEGFSVHQRVKINQFNQFIYLKKQCAQVIAPIEFVVNAAIFESIIQSHPEIDVGNIFVPEDPAEGNSRCPFSLFRPKSFRA